MPDSDRAADSPDLPTARDRLFHRLANAVTVGVQMIPFPLTLWIARRLAIIAFWLGRKHRRRALDNLKLAFGDRYSERQRRRLARRVFQSFAMSFAEGIHLPVLARSGRLSRLLEFTGPHDLVKECSEKGAVLMVSGHLGSWEFVLGGLALSGIEVVAVMRPTPLPWLNEWMRGLRLGTGHRLSAKKGALADMREAIEGGECVGILVDQHNRHGIEVDFFGHPARTTQVVGLLAQRFAVPVFMGYVERVVPGKRYRYSCVGPIEVERTGSRHEHTLAVTQRCTSILEGWIRQAPEQWFWVHRRWRLPRTPEPAADSSERRPRGQEQEGPHRADAPQGESLPRRG